MYILSEMQGLRPCLQHRNWIVLQQLEGPPTENGLGGALLGGRIKRPDIFSPSSRSSIALSGVKLKEAARHQRGGVPARDPVTFMSGECTPFEAWRTLKRRAGGVRYFWRYRPVG